MESPGLHSHWELASYWWERMESHGLHSYRERLPLRTGDIVQTVSPQLSTVPDVEEWTP